nr:MAG TPA: hypothetical protein [Caudoviricetes sp.]
MGGVVKGAQIGLHGLSRAGVCACARAGVVGGVHIEVVVSRRWGRRTRVR